MNDLHITTAVLGVGLAAGILFLLRRDHLYLRDGLFWIAVAMASIAFGVWPSLVDALGQIAGVAYPPTLLLIVGGVILTIRALFADIAVTALRRDLRRLNQKIALIEVAGNEAKNGDRGQGTGAGSTGKAAVALPE